MLWNQLQYIYLVGCMKCIRNLPRSILEISGFVVLHRCNATFLTIKLRGLSSKR